MHQPSPSDPEKGIEARAYCAREFSERRKSFEIRIRVLERTEIAGTAPRNEVCKAISSAVAAHNRLLQWVDDAGHLCGVTRESAMRVTAAAQGMRDRAMAVCVALPPHQTKFRR
jgi:hypothetical protein